MRKTPFAAAALAAGSVLFVAGPALAIAQPCVTGAYAGSICPVTPSTGVSSDVGTPGPSGSASTPVTVSSTGGTNTPGDPTLPFNGGEFVLMSLVGIGAIAGGGALVVAGRKRHTGTHAA